jgi:hypothetical protein
VNARGVLLAAVPLALLPRAALADCGLDECPRFSKMPARLGVAVAARHTEFDWLSTRGDHTRYNLRLDYRARDRVWLRGAVSRATVHVPDKQRSGFTNPLLVTQFALLQRERSLAAVGVQWEVPIDSPVAADHHEFLAYSLFDWMPEGTGIEVAAGYRFSADGDDDEHDAQPAAAPSTPRSTIALHANHDGPDYAAFVNPHEEREIMWRTGTARPLPWRWLPLTAAVEGQHPVDGGAFVTGELGALVDVGRGYRLAPSISGPLSSDRRYDWFLALEVRRR